jgi:hypothetical protein
MTAEHHLRDQVARGWIEVWRRRDGFWGVSWEPALGQPDYPGVTYTPGDALRPADFPSEYDPSVLLAWARIQWGGETT